MNVSVLDDECPPGTIYRVTAEFYRERLQPRLDALPEDATTVTLVHPSDVDKLDIPVFDLSWA